LSGAIEFLRIAHGTLADAHTTHRRTVRLAVRRPRPARHARRPPQGKPRGRESFSGNDLPHGKRLTRKRLPTPSARFHQEIPGRVLKIADRRAHPRWEVPVKTLRDEHLSADLSPWNYPVYVIAQGTGFASIHGCASDGRPLTAIAFFTTSERACDYLRDAGETGELCELTDLRLTRRFLDRLALEIFAVAVDPVVDDAGRTAKYCFDIATLLEKYLVAAP
jgi:hypothetical protein